jgi:hypothetical protein
MCLTSTRDGLERLQLADNASVADLVQQINTTLNIPAEGMILSRDKDLVRRRLRIHSNVICMPVCHLTSCQSLIEGTGLLYVGAMRFVESYAIDVV